MDPGQDPTAGFLSGFIVVSTVNIWCTKQSGLYQYSICNKIRHTLLLLYLDFLPKTTVDASICTCITLNRNVGVSALYVS